MTPRPASFAADIQGSEEHHPSIGRVTRREDFERLLAVRPCARSTHFLVHRLALASMQSCDSAPAGAPLRREAAGSEELSTGHEPKLSLPVDKMAGQILVGCVVPKRHARRAVTRNLVRRQIHAAVRRRAADMSPGIWVVRLRAGFDREGFVSADSPGLRAAVRSELDALLARARR